MKVARIYFINGKYETFSAKDICEYNGSLLFYDENNSIVARIYLKNIAGYEILPDTVTYAGCMITNNGETLI